MVLHMIMILTKEFEGQFEWLGENTRKYITFSLENSLIMIKQLQRNKNY